MRRKSIQENLPLPPAPTSTSTSTTTHARSKSLGGLSSLAGLKPRVSILKKLPPSAPLEDHTINIPIISRDYPPVSTAPPPPPSAEVPRTRDPERRASRVSFAPTCSVRLFDLPSEKVAPPPPPASKEEQDESQEMDLSFASFGSSSASMVEGGEGEDFTLDLGGVMFNSKATAEQVGALPVAASGRSTQATSAQLPITNSAHSSLPFVNTGNLPLMDDVVNESLDMNLDSSEGEEGMEVEQEIQRMKGSGSGKPRFSLSADEVELRAQQQQQGKKSRFSISADDTEIGVQQQHQQQSKKPRFSISADTAELGAQQQQQNKKIRFSMSADETELTIQQPSQQQSQQQSQSQAQTQPHANNKKTRFSLSADETEMWIQQAPQQPRKKARVSITADDTEIRMQQQQQQQQGKRSRLSISSFPAGNQNSYNTIPEEEHESDSDSDSDDTGVFMDMSNSAMTVDITRELAVANGEQTMVLDQTTQHGSRHKSDDDGVTHDLIKFSQARQIHQHDDGNDKGNDDNENDTQASMMMDFTDEMGDLTRAVEAAAPKINNSIPARHEQAHPVANPMSSYQSSNAVSTSKTDENAISQYRTDDKNQASFRSPVKYSDHTTASLAKVKTPSKSPRSAKFDPLAAFSLDSPDKSSHSAMAAARPMGGAGWAPSPRTKAGFNAISFSLGNLDDPDSFSLPKESQKIMSQLHTEAEDAFSQHVDHTGSSAGTSHDPISLKQFLDMAGVQFLDDMDVRRRSMAGRDALGMTPRKRGALSQSATRSDLPYSTEEFVIAGSVTVPILVEIQFGCKEMKAGILGCRRVIQLQEESVDESQPNLFGQYLSADPYIKRKMEMQLKLIKRNARLLAEQRWYSWRHHTFSEEQYDEIVVRALNSFVEDQSIIRKSRSAIAFIPALKAKKEALRQHLLKERQLVHDLQTTDPSHVGDLEEGIAEQRSQIEEWKLRVATLEEEASTVASQVKYKQDQLSSIQASVAALNERYELFKEQTTEEAFRRKYLWDSIQNFHGWSAVSLSETAYHFKLVDDHISLGIQFDKQGSINLTSQVVQNENDRGTAQLSLTLIIFMANSIVRLCQTEHEASPMTPGAYMQKSLVYLARAKQAISDISTINKQYPITFKPTSEGDNLEVFVSIFLEDIEAKAVLKLVLQPQIVRDNLSVETDVEIKYGDIDVVRMKDALSQGLKSMEMCESVRAAVATCQ